MSVKSIKRMLRDTIYTHMTTQMATELSGVTVAKAMAGTVLPERHIRIATPTSEPHIAGGRNLGRWTVTASITAVSQVDDYDEDAHDNMIGLIEAYVLQGNGALATALTDSDIAVDVVQPGAGGEVAIEGLLYSSQELVCECYAK